MFSEVTFVCSSPSGNVCTSAARVRIYKSACLSDAGPGEGYNDSHNIDCQLELQELGDAVVDVAAPHHRLDDAAEVVISQDDVRRLFGHVCPRDALTEIEAVRRTHDMSQR